jgi:hypothetical protein
MSNKNKDANILISTEKSDKVFKKVSMILSELELLTTGNKKDNIVNTEKIH